MANSIEQRAIIAKDKEVSRRNVGSMGDYWFIQGYIQGARDQRKLDIDGTQELHINADELTSEQLNKIIVRCADILRYRAELNEKRYEENI